MPLSAEEIIQIAKKKINVQEISCLDLSDQHKNHPGTASGGGHYKLSIVSQDFANLSRLQRQRKVLSIFSKHFQENLIHALSLELKAP